ncbi:MAG: hypothetical protein VX378_11640 [Pseudomonadota bacterium]|nr:hypothetical protein [Pseudomonadota bacterium]MEE3071740.1 hypothetical protein [Pseudomonadota bacterium]
MKKVKVWMADVLVAIVLVAGFGFGLMAMGGALVLGLMIAVAMRLAGPHLLAEAERRASDLRAQGARRVDPDAVYEDHGHSPA